MKPYILLGFSMIVILISALAFINNENEIPEKHIEVVLRDIGHQLLLSTKDSTSRVLPIKKLTVNSYQVSFQNNVGFISDSIINIVQRSFLKNALANNYIVNLRNCEQREPVLAFELNGKTGDLTPCRGRKLEMDCYILQIDLLREAKSNSLWLLLLIIPLTFAGFYIKNNLQRKETPKMIPDNSDYIQVGKFQLYTAHNVLKNEFKTITLSEKETKALEIFVQNINQVVDREKLMKELWENEGTIVISRNVDVLVSKLRKKLSEEDSLKFVNVPGKGYKLTAEVKMV